MRRVVIAVVTDNELTDETLKIVNDLFFVFVILYYLY